MARPLNKLELGIIAQLAQGATFADLRVALDAKPIAISNAIQALRWRGLIQWERLALPGQPDSVAPAETPVEVISDLVGDNADAVHPSDAAGLPGLGEDLVLGQLLDAPSVGVTDLGKDHAEKAEGLVVGHARQARPARPRKEALPVPVPAPARERGSVFVYPARPAPRAGVPTIGAVEPLPAEFRREALIAAKRRQTAHANRLAGKGKAAEVTRWEAEKAAADAARLADPLEQAKTRLRRRGFTVFAAEVTGRPKGKFYVGGRLLTEAELMAKAG